MRPTASNPASWLDTLWEAIWGWEDTNPDAARVDDVKTAMVWISEALGVDGEGNAIKGEK